MSKNKAAITAFLNGITQSDGHQRHASLEEVRSEEVQEIMGKMPPWIVRSGITLIGILVLCAFGSAWFFRYPEVVPANVVITPYMQTYAVRGDVAAADTWKIKAGQKVLIKLTAYPYDEFGMLQGTVTSRAGVMTDSTFYVEIKLDNNLFTSTGKEIPPQFRLEGKAEILQEDRSILQRLFGKLF
ncbi:hypothetical protein CLV51_102890 [Chitinophaga niastensis]|uniref:HlyD family secretion protein n=1 Tax=Chitinophaga niastensis TaxID=536980 RepID=A0A2P8HP83_CHINA|nr:hypothetical protein [Chitinophaga niastensis]PSL48030.1 hypothetical protein CLV51_102890 [Chitinophaga niastensis]